MIIKRYATIDSTNLEAFRRKDESDDFSVFVTDYQTAGRGQRGNSWESAAGKNLTFSILLKPSFLRVEKQHLISKAAALGVSGYVDSCGVPSKIKWPNDIYVEDRKIGGILIEHIISGSHIVCSVVGIGLNVNQISFGTDAPNPTSLYIEKKRYCADSSELLPFSLFLELDSLLLSIKRYYDVLQQIDDFGNMFNPNYIDQEIDRPYLWKMYRYGKYYQYFDCLRDVAFEGMIVGIDETFRLLIEERSGLLNRFAFKEVRYL